jgi:hypothetical protein
VGSGVLPEGRKLKFLAILDWKVTKFLLEGWKLM